ncbi:efflux RND transporter permease subunit [Brevundimonas sp. GCM10030266]|uniref:efflux RND transporter permease subunit n=1 Tax=Brevundimonas sp. GCM10030266 TaxID=3273386 RepID=UPI00361C70CF
MTLATWSLRNPIPVILLFVLLTIAGVWGFTSLAKQDLPDLDLPTVTVSLVQPGAAPAQLETEVARKVENAVAAVAGLKHVTTTITDGSVSIQAQFQLEKPLATALSETRDAVDSIRSDLPEDLQPPIVTATNVVGGAILTYAVSAPGLDEEALSWLVDDAVSRAVLKVEGVGRFARVGGVDREIRVEVDPVRLTGLGVTAADVSQALRAMQQENSGGRSQVSGGDQAVRVIATVKEAADLAALPIVVGDRRLRLDQVATIRDTTGDRSQGARLDGRPAVAFEVFRARGADETRIAAGVADALNTLEQERPGVRFTVVADTTVNTQDQFSGSMQMLVEGAILAVIVVFIFLRDWRATLIAAVALPLSILPTFAAMSWMGFSLNTVTLLALTVSVGILVDDAIVEVENIARHRQMGKPAAVATADAVNEIALAVLATTLTLVAVFLPTSLMPGLAGIFFKQFGWTAAIAVLASLLVARLVTPLMAARMLRDHPPKPTRDGWLMTRYLATVRWSLRRRWIALGATVLAFGASAAIVPFLSTGMIPASDTGQTTISLELPPGSAYADTLAAAESARAAVANLEGVDSVFTAIGAGGESAGGDVAAAVRRATLILDLADRGARPGLQDIERQVRERMAGVPGVRYSVGGGGGPGGALSLILAGDDADALKQAALRFENELRAVGSLSSVSSTASLERAELVVRPDLERAAEQGVSTADIGDTVRIATSGDYVMALARLNLENRQTPIRVRMSDTDRADFDTLAGLRVAAANGTVPLSSLADIRLETGPSQIDRYDRQRFVTVSADLNGMALGDATRQAMALPAVRDLPSSVQLIETGDAELGAELGAGFVFAFVTGVLCMYCVLVLLFRDPLQPITILSAVPLALGGVFVALLVTGSELNLPVMIGVVLLTGVVTKNSILLVEHALVGIHKEGLGRGEALLAACHARARPILMTSLAMIAGMAPIALGLGAEPSFRQPMAIAVIGGLVTSTLLSLVFVPVAFSLMAGFEGRVVRLTRRLRSSGATPTSAPEVR